MAAETKIVKGGFRATLALIVSIIALILFILAYMSATREEDLRSRMGDLQTRMEKMKQESAKQMDKLRGETANALERLGRAIKKDKRKQNKKAKSSGILVFQRGFLFTYESTIEWYYAHLSGRREG